MVTEYRGPGNGFRSFLSTMQSVTGVKAMNFSNLSGWCFARMVAPNLAIYKAVTLVGLLWVPLWLLVITIIFFLIRFCCQLCGRLLQRRYLKVYMAMTLYLSLTRITSMCLTPFQCFNADRPRHLLDTRIVCDGDHSTWQWIGVAGFIIYSCGIPLGFLGLMTWSKRRDQLAIPDVQAMVAFLQSGLEPRLHQFECIFMFRKVLFLLVMYLAGESAASTVVKCYCIMAVVGLFWLIHVTFSPYANRAYFLLDKIEGASLMAVFATLIGQIGLWSSADPITLKNHPIYGQAVKLCVYVGVIGCHVLFLLLVIWGFLRRLVLKYFIWGPAQRFLGQ